MGPQPTFSAKNIDISSTSGRDRAPDISKKPDLGSFLGLFGVSNMLKNDPKSGFFEMSGALSRPLEHENTIFFAQNVG